MCGILGATQKDESLVRKAAATFAYRGPDGFGIWSDERVTLGHHRLAIIDLDPRANQPMVGESGDVRITYNGEIYNFPSLKEELTREGHTFRTTSDTEVILASYAQWGEKFVEHIEGMYALALYDAREGKLLLVTDRENIKPIFYAFENGVCHFASEVKGVASMLKTAGRTLTLDREALDLFYVFGYVPAPRTLYKEIRRMGKRGMVVVDLKKAAIDERTYAVKKPQARSEEELKTLLEKKIQAHLIADVPVGVFFSGGTDSSLIVSVLHKLGVQLETFSIRVAERGGDRKYFEAIAKELDIHAHMYDFDLAAFEESYRDIMHLLDEPLADNSLLPTYYVSKKAAERVTVVLSGEGGDELFCGYPRSLLLNDLNGRFDKRVGVAERLFFLLPSFKGKNRVFERLFILLRRPVAYYLLTMSPARDFLTLRAWRAAKRTIIETSTEPPRFDYELYLDGDLLRKTDHATMYASIEGRVPLLDLDVVAAAQTERLPRGPELKPLLKKILAQYLPKELVYRPKTGFGLKLSVFFRGSSLTKNDLKAALEFLKKRDLVPPSVPSSTDRLIASRPDFCWQLIALYHSVKNIEAL